jgi:hypothetical protein
MDNIKLPLRSVGVVYFVITHVYVIPCFTSRDWSCMHKQKVNPTYNFPNIYHKQFLMYAQEGNLHDHPFYPVCPDVLSLEIDPLSGNGCGSPNQI